MDFYESLKLKTKIKKEKVLKLWENVYGKLNKKIKQNKKEIGIIGKK